MMTMNWVSIADLKIGFDEAVAELNLSLCYELNRVSMLWLKGMNNRHPQKPKWNLIQYKIYYRNILRILLSNLTRAVQLNHFHNRVECRAL